MFIFHRPFWASLTLAGFAWLAFVALSLFGLSLVLVTSAVLACLGLLWRFKPWALLALACLVAAPALAQTDVVSAQPIVGGFAGYVAAIIGAAVPVLLGFLFAEFKALTKMSINADLQAQVSAWATTEAEALAASIEGNLGSKSFTVGSPEVATIVNAAPAEILKILANLGLGPDALAKLVVAAIGRLQSAAAPAK